MKAFYLSVIIALLASGCASLRVDVSMYTGPKPVPSEEARKLIDTVAKMPIFNPSSRAALKDEVLNQIRNVVVTANTAALRTAKPPALHPEEKAEQFWKNMRQGFADEWEKSIGAPAVQVEQALHALEATLTSAQPSLNMLTGDAIRPYYALRAALGHYSASFSGFRRKVEGFLESTIRQLDDLDRQDAAVVEVKNAKRRSEETINELSADRVAGIASSGAITGRLVGYPIFDPQIPGLSRESTDWVDFGTTKFSANGGNAQFVVVQEGLLVFRKKSLDFDPTAVVGAGTALTRVGLKVAAALASGATGLPISSIASAAPGTSESGESTEEQLVINAAEIAAGKRQLKQRSLAKQEYLAALADLYERAVKPGANLDELQKEFEKITNFYQSRTLNKLENPP